jgi:hypothetical protein
MKNIIKAAKLDYALMKGHIWSICVAVAVPLLFIYGGSALVVGISLAMGLTAMGLQHTFSVADKNDMSRMYGIIPITKRELVIGKYLHAAILGIIVLAASLTIQVITLGYIGTAFETTDIFIAALMGIVLYLLFVSVQLPGLYKFGSINGRIFIMLPFIFVIIANMVITRSGIDFATLVNFASTNQALMVIIAVILIVLLLVASIEISIKILGNKEM